MALDFLVVDDYPEMLNIVVAYIKIEASKLNINDITIQTFQSGIQALNYLDNNLSNLPNGSIVDMRLGSSKEELASSERIYEFLKTHSAHEDFVFFTGHLSEHDVAVHQRTGARVLIKGHDQEQFKGFIHSVLKKYHSEAI